MGMRIVTFKAEEEFLEMIDLTARELGITRSELIRLALEKFIKLKGVDGIYKLVREGRRSYI